MTITEAPPAPLGWCVSCLGAKQMIDAGDFTPTAKKHNYNEAAVVVYRGNGLCLRHFNTARGFPPDYPQVPLPDSIRESMNLDPLEQQDRDEPPRPGRRRRRNDG